MLYQHEHDVTQEEFVSSTEENKNLLNPTQQKAEEEVVPDKWKYVKLAFKGTKITILFVLLLLGIVFFALNAEVDPENPFALSASAPLTLYLNDEKSMAYVQCVLSYAPPKEYFGPPKDDPDHLYGQKLTSGGGGGGAIVDFLFDVKAVLEAGDEYNLDNFTEVTSTVMQLINPHGNSSQAVNHIFYIPPEYRSQVVRLVFHTDIDRPMPVSLRLTQHSDAFAARIPLAFVILCGVYVLIIFELVNRTIATIAGAFMTIAAMGLMGLRPTLHDITVWVEYHTLILLFGMMIIVSIFSTTGFFEWVALRAYKLSRNNIWLLVVLLSTLCGVTSAFLDNVTSMLLLTPVIVRISKVIDISPVPLLIATVVISNIGGCATAVGDPPVTLIVNTPAIKAAGIGFNEILFFMAPGTVFIGVICLTCIRFLYWKEFSQKPKQLSPEVAHLKKEIEVWKGTFERLSGAEDEKPVQEKLQNYINTLEEELEQKSKAGAVDISALEKEYQIRDKPLFVTCGIILSVVVLLFFIENFIQDWVHLSLDTTALLGALAVVILADVHNFDHVLEKVEWSTLLFFATLFIMMGGLDRLGLIDLVGDSVTNVIAKVSPRYQLVVAITIIVWLSAIVSAIIDSIPYTTAMIPVVLAISDSLHLPLKPLVFSLAYGTGLGGNGTLIGSTANLVVAGIAEKFGYPISFLQFFKIGMPIMLLSTLLSNVYLLFVHCVLKLGLDGYDFS